MAKEELIEAQGVVHEILPDSRFRVTLDNGHELIAYTGGKDLFAHFKEIQGEGFKVLTENQRVQFEVTQGQKGPQASRIRAV